MRIRFLCVVLVAMLPGLASAIALGPIEVSSKLNQRLNATVALVARNVEELEDARAVLADQATFDKAGLERPFVLTKLRFEIVADDGASYIKISSKESIREPQLSFILEFESPSGRLQREYTLLLRPSAASSLDRY